MSYALGLDFGTSFTAAAVEQDNVVRVATLGNRAGAVPASVFLRPDGSLIHGEEAFMRGASEPLRLVRKLKRRLGDSPNIQVSGTTVEPMQLVADHLRWAVTRVAEREGGPPDRLVLTHPASWRSSRLEGFLKAVERAELDPEFVTEPHAAAMFHAESHPLAVGDLVAAYDLGGGTFDAAVLRRTRGGFELAGEPEGEDHLGGIDFDDVVLHLVQARLGDRWNAAKREGGSGFEAALAGLRRECVSAKEALSVETEVELPVMLPGVMAPVHISRRDFEHLVKPAVDESIGSFRRAVAAAGTTMNELSAVLMVGGSCRLPIVRESVEKAIGPNTVVLDADPKHAVARGAAVLAGELPARTVVRGDWATQAAPPSSSPPSVATIDLREKPQTQPTSESQRASEPQRASEAELAAAAALSPAAVALEAAGAPARITVPFEPGIDAPQSETVGATDGVFGETEVQPPRDLPPTVVPDEPDDESSRKLPLLAIAVVGLLLLALPIGLWLTRDSGDGGPEGQASDFTVVEGGDSPQFNSGETAAAESDPAVPELVTASSFDMAEVAGGQFTLGSVDGPESLASFTTDVQPFFVDVYETTNQDYLAFVQTVGAPPPLSWPRAAFPMVNWITRSLASSTCGPRPIAPRWASACPRSQSGKLLLAGQKAPFIRRVTPPMGSTWMCRVGARLGPTPGMSVGLECSMVSEASGNGSGSRTPRWKTASEFVAVARTDGSATVLQCAKWWTHRGKRRSLRPASVASQMMWTRDSHPCSSTQPMADLMLPPMQTGHVRPRWALICWWTRPSMTLAPGSPK